jgi:triosephosphate isomerase
MTTRRRIVAGNWKMNHGPVATRDFFTRFHPRANDGGPRILVFPPAVSLAAAVGARERDPRVELGVQNVHEAASGAYTGEISAPMAAEAGATAALVGHSERRHVFGEDDARVAAKVGAILSADLLPVICVGETLDQRRAGRLEEVILGQLEAAVAPIPAGRAFVLAYEPVWAIGTGETATPRDAAEAHGALRRRAGELRGADESARLPILYGGSVKPGNAAELMDADDVDGVLVGGASLDPGSFSRIVEAA